MRCFAAIAAVLCLFESTAATAWIGATNPTPTVKRAVDDPASRGFVTTEDGNFMRNGRPFFYFGTNAYWLAHLSDDNLNLTMKSIAARNITVVRTWAFNDVTEIPSSGAWFQLFQPNGSVVINKGPSGFGRLDAIVAAAEANNLLVQFTLTNNWNPEPNVTAALRKRADGTELPRGSLSNEYGGMDAYVRAHNLSTHDQFFTNQTLIDAFQNYLNELIPRYQNHTSVLAWEIANDPRCNSTVADSGGCLSANVTRWHSTISEHVSTLDPNHLLTTGTSGFQCISQNATKCEKLFPLTTATPAPTPQPSPAANQRRRMEFSERGILKERKARFKRNADALQRRVANASEKRKRGDKVRWSYRKGSFESSTTFKRQVQQGISSMGSAFDGSQRVDSQDISNIPQIGFATTQLFPDQNTYGPVMPGLNAFNNTLQAGIAWINAQAAAARQVSKPLAITAFGLVSQDNLPFFVPFNSSQPLFPDANATATSTSTSATPTSTPPGVGVEQGQSAFTDQEQADIFQGWLQAALEDNVQGVVQYQWGQTQLTPPEQEVTNTPDNQNTFSPALAEQGVSPNDGYQTFSPVVQDVLQLFAIQLNLRSIQLGSAFPDDS